jgi:four helix bundle protein
MLYFVQKKLTLKVSPFQINPINRKANKMKNEDLKDRTLRFSIRIMSLVESLPSAKSLTVISNQILRSATSVGANYRAARRAKSGKDFINKLKIVEEETDETLYWLLLIQQCGLVKAENLDNLISEANELLAIFVASLKTAKLNLGVK